MINIISDDSFSPALYSSGDEPQHINQHQWLLTWRYLRGKPTAWYSLWFMGALTLCIILGPSLWPLDPAAQDVSRFSQAPTLRSTALLVKTPTVPATAQNMTNTLPTHDTPPANAVAQLHATQTTTAGVVIAWSAAPDATRYVIYRHILLPSGPFDLGIPLGEINASSEPQYLDQLQLQARQYYYTVIAANERGEAKRYATLAVDVDTGITIDNAVAQHLVDSENARNGVVITLPTHPLGTDHLGRDMLARLLQGGRVSLLIGILAPLACTLLGTLYGSIAGYAGGHTDQLMMRFADFVIALPFLLFMILLKVVLGGTHSNGVLPIIIALIVLSWPSTARLVRGQVLQLRTLPYVDAARLSGGTPWYLLYKHILPNTLGVILVSLTFSIPAAIFTEAFLSFIGIGVSSPLTSWGAMCNDGLSVLLSYPHEFLLPALLISLFVLACNLLGEGLRDALDVATRDTTGSGL